MSAVKTYPLAIASSAWERRMANWANSRTAVIESFTNIAAAYIGMKASMRASGTVDRGPAVTTNAAISASTTARASRRCAGVGGRLAMVKAGPSGTVVRVFTMVPTKRARRNAHAKHTSCGRRHEVVRLSRSAPFRPAERLAARRRLARTCRGHSVPRRGRAQGRRSRNPAIGPRRPGRVVRNDDDAMGERGLDHPRGRPTSGGESPIGRALPFMLSDSEANWGRNQVTASESALTLGLRWRDQRRRTRQHGEAVWRQAVASRRERSRGPADVVQAGQARRLTGSRRHRRRQLHSRRRARPIHSRWRLHRRGLGGRAGETPDARRLFLTRQWPARPTRTR